MVAEGQIGAASYPVAWLLYQHGFRWDDDGHWARVASQPDLAARLRRDDLLVVDEAGMLDQDTARALLVLAEETGVRVGAGRRPAPAARRRPRGSPRPGRPLRRRPDAHPGRGAPLRRPRLRRPVAADAPRHTSRRGVRRARRARRRSWSMPARSNGSRPSPSGPAGASWWSPTPANRWRRINALAHRVRVVTGEASDAVSRPGQGSGSGSGTGSRPAATTPTPTSPTAKPGPSPPPRHGGLTVGRRGRATHPVLPTTCGSMSSSPTPPPPTAPKAPPSRSHMCRSATIPAPRRPTSA